MLQIQVFRSSEHDFPAQVKVGVFQTMQLLVQLIQNAIALSQTEDIKIVIRWTSKQSSDNDHPLTLAYQLKS